MNRTLILSVLLLFSVALFAQQSSFKVKNKKPKGTTPVSMKYKTTNGASNLKSTSLKPYKILPQMVKPALQPPKGLITRIERDHSLVYIEKAGASLKSATVVSSEEEFYNFFESIRSVSGLQNPRESFVISKIESDKLGITHFKSVQLYRGIEIDGSESTLHIDSAKERFTGRIVNVTNEVDINPKISSTVAVQKTVENLKQQTVVKELSEQQKVILEYNSPQYKLVVCKNGNGSFTLAYEIDVRPNFIEVWKYVVDAHSGEIIKKFNATNSDGPATAVAVDLNNAQRNINTYLEKGNYYLRDASQPMFQSATMEGIIETLDANYTSTQNMDFYYVTSTNNKWSSKTAVSAHANAIETYNYLYDKFKRNSLNDNGCNIYSLINVTEDDGSSMDNAYWNGKAAFFGNGSIFKPLAGAQDVMSHELGHGVVSNTANLEYYAQSGAINETYADIFGAMVDRDDWKIGEDVVRTEYFPSGALRDMSNPHNGGTSLSDNSWQPAHISEMYIGEEDNAGVHTNSGIGNFAYYLYASAVSKDKAEQVFYRALTNYLTKNSQFIDFRVAVVQSAVDLYGNSSAEVTEAKRAFDKVGIYTEEPVKEDQEYEVNQGANYVLSYNTDTQYSYKLYRTNTDGDDFKPLTKTDMKGKVSVTDDGYVAAFVSPDDEIRTIVLDPDNVEEYVITEDAFWDNVAVSKDGMRLAGISTEIDASIYVYDFETGEWMQFELYNPTTSSSNTEGGGVLYADEIEFDITGEYLIYDSYNELSSTSTDAIGYWDIGFIKVWDNTANTFGDGSISKLYGSLPENVSIGNPVFSRNSPNIIAFDYFDEVNDEYAIIGGDLLTTEIDVIYVNTTLGFPSFSILDDKIAFSAISTSDDEVVGVIGLANNKISASGDASLLIDQARWPVYYATGNRALGLPPTANFTVDYKRGAAPFAVRFFDASLNNPTSWNWSFNGGSPSSSSEQNPLVTYNNTGIYSVSLTAKNSIGSNSVSKSDYIEVVLSTDVNKSGINLISIYPNPTNDKLTIDYSGDFSLKLFDLDGKMLMKNENLRQIDLSEMKPGVYFIEMETENGKLRNKIIKN